MKEKRKKINKHILVFSFVNGNYDNQWTSLQSHTTTVFRESFVKIHSILKF